MHRFFFGSSDFFDTLLNDLAHPRPFAHPRVPQLPSLPPFLISATFSHLLRFYHVVHPTLLPLPSYLSCPIPRQYNRPIFSMTCAMPVFNMTLNLVSCLRGVSNIYISSK